MPPPSAGGDRGGFEKQYLGRGRAMSPAELRAWWRAAGEKLVAAARTVDAKARLPWYGPEMGAVSHVTARLMETWSHGLDVVDVVDAGGPTRTGCGTSRSSACRTRPFSYSQPRGNLEDRPFESS